ncbi:hypothetical protein JI58_00685 [Marinosulfonomonas sp. PRT-SC04]|nr:hypothetical protein JI58_00685 [Marinosulfonomonas sp. PRT-SC04]
MRADLKALRAELHLLNTHRFVRIHNSMWRLISFQFIRGLAFGLGSVIGATALVSVLVYSLSTIDFIPIIGEWAKRIVDMITQSNGDL